MIAEIYAQALEGDGFSVDRQLGLGPRVPVAAAFEEGQIDLTPEYVGSGLGYYVLGSENAELAALEMSGDGETNRANLQAAYDLQGIDATVLGITPGEDTNAFVVRQDTADEFGLVSIGDLAAVQDQLVFGLPSECEVNALCKGALEQYGIDFDALQKELLDACDAPIAQALAGGAIDVGELCSTQPAIAQNGFVELADDLETQPAENLAPVVRNDFLAQVDGGADAIAAILDPISAADHDRGPDRSRRPRRGRSGGHRGCRCRVPGRSRQLGLRGPCGPNTQPATPGTTLESSLMVLAAR